MLVVENIQYRIRKKQLLDNISFRVDTGEVLAVLGPNGAGKSTLLKILCKELNASGGSILFHERDIDSYSIAEMAKLRSVLNQQNFLSVSFVVEELVMMGRYPYFRHEPSAQDREIVASLLEQVGLTHLAKRDFNGLSGGEQQRVLLARALAQITGQEQALLFLDEPTNGLDLRYQKEIMKAARNWASLGHGVFCIVHDLNLAAQYADRILLLNKGKQEAFGTPDEVLSPDLLSRVFEVDIRVVHSPEFEHPVILPRL